VKIIKLILPVCLSLSACWHKNETPITHPENWDVELRVPAAIDVNPASDIVEVYLEAKETDVELIPGVQTRMWTYNGQFPGPQIDAKLGDTLIVHLTNSLPEDTTIHWHGLELPATMDGSHISQLAVKPGESFTYQFKLNHAATYWYHPHIQAYEQVERGLYGALVVRDTQYERELGLPVSSEVVVILDDILLDDAGQIVFNPSSDPLQKATQQANGREGNWFAINGKVFPVQDNAFSLPNLNVRSGVPVRLRLINAANARFFRVAMPDYNLYQIGGDGGLLETPQTRPPIDVLEAVQTQKAKPNPRHIDGITYRANPDLSKGLMLVPGERGDVVFTPIGYPGDSKFLEWFYHDRGAHKAMYDDTGQIMLSHEHDTSSLIWFSRLIRFTFTDDSDWLADEYLPPQKLRTIEILDTSAATTLPVVFGHSMPDANGDITFFATMNNGSGVPFDQVTPELALKAKIGQTYIWEVSNLTQGDHPFHPHGFRFQWLETRYEDIDFPDKNRVETANVREWKDTIRVPGRSGEMGQSRTIMRLAVRFDDTGREGQVAASGKVPDSNGSGGWFVHCHILEHSARGMGTFLELSY